MKIFYEDSVLRKIRNAIDDARSRDKTVKRVLLDKSEWQEFCRQVKIPQISAGHHFMDVLVETDWSE